MLFRSAKIPTNRSDIALKFINVTDDQGANGEFGAGSWWQYSFRKGDFMFRRDNVLTMVPKPAKVAFAVFPNLHATFYAQPQLLADRKADRKQD